MKVRRQEAWGEIEYSNSTHEFCAKNQRDDMPTPYVGSPIVLNVDLTFRCNMNCVYCVARDTAKQVGKECDTDLIITPDLINRINSSPFMLIVITGGEPFHPACRDALHKIIRSIRNKGMVIDTNGTVLPSSRLLKTLKSKRILVRISWDSPNPTQEVTLRRYGHLFDSPTEYLSRKLEVIRAFADYGIPVAIQSVVHGLNYSDSNFHRMPFKLQEMGISLWYLQRIIPSHQLLTDSQRSKRLLTYSEYAACVDTLSAYARRANVKCIHKMDKRHNSVFLLVGDGVLYTQSDTVAGQKVRLGRIGEFNDYFSFVSAADHSTRYYFEGQ